MVFYLFRAAKIRIFFVLKMVKSGHSREVGGMGKLGTMVGKLGTFVGRFLAFFDFGLILVGDLGFLGDLGGLGF